MPYRPRDIYRGRRKFRVPLAIALFVLAFLLIGSIGMFYFLQQFLVYDQNGVTLALPFMQTETEAVEDAAPEPTLAPVPVQVIYDDPDFTDLDLGGWQTLSATRARYVSFSDAADEMKLNAAVAALPDEYTGVVLELKGRDGRLAWASQTEMAVGYGASGTMDYTEMVAALHEDGLTAAAVISCCADELLAVRDRPVALQLYGEAYQDDGAYWLDPYNLTVRNYIAELMAELADMGFDEIILADLAHPVTDAELTYSVTIQTEPDPVNAVCQMARRLAESMEGTGVAVSAMLDTSSLRNGSAAQSGQDLSILWRVFARLYCPTDYWSAATDLEYAAESLNDGDAAVRFVPVSEYAPDGFDSYVIR